MEVVRAACFALVAALAFGQTTSRIEGRVLSDTGQPLSKATVAFHGVRSTSVETGDDGRFSITAFQPGKYSVRIERSGYASPGLEPGLSTTVWLDQGQVQQDLVFKMSPQAVITGRVTDADGDPLSGAVTAYRETYQGRSKALVVRGSVSVDEKGNFRLAGLAPGRYYLAVGFEPPGARFGAETLYPNSPDFEHAMPITVRAGDDLRGMNILTRTDQHRVSIRGRVVDITNGQPVQAQFLTLTPREARVTGGANVSARSDGSFEIQHVTAGQYFLRTLFSTTNSSNMGQVELAVGNQDLEDVVLPVRPAMKLQGAIQVEGGDLSTKPFVRLIPTGPPFNGSDPTGQAGAGGSFQLENVAPVKYLIELHNLPEGTYVKSIHLADRDITHAPLDLTSGVEAALTVLLAPHAAIVDGVVVPNAVVAIWRKDHADEVSTALAGQKGAFRFANLAPGDYRILAWDDIEPGLAEHEPFRTRFNDRAVSLTLSQD